jgi:hypothetical protein
MAVALQGEPSVSEAKGPKALQQSLRAHQFAFLHRRVSLDPRSSGALRFVLNRWARIPHDEFLWDTMVRLKTLHRLSPKTPRVT